MCTDKPWQLYEQKQAILASTEWRKGNRSSDRHHTIFSNGCQCRTNVVSLHVDDGEDEVVVPFNLQEQSVGETKEYFYCSYL
jgi:hypothetical protein